MRLPNAALALCLLGLLAIPARARAETVLFACSEQCPVALFEALELELRGHGAFLVSRLSPSGFTVAAHESDARRMAGLTPAAAVLWIERDPPLRVRVLAPGDAAVREAPLATPPDQIDARVFAAIAGDVVLRALGAPGHAAAPGPVAPTSETTVANPALPPRERAQPAATGKRERVRRFFLRAGGALGFVRVKEGLPVDRQPPSRFVQSALQVQLATNSVEAGREALAKSGYDCDWRANPSLPGGGMIASDCRVTVDKRGYVVSPAFELQAGAHLTERFALASFLRLTPTAGRGSFNHALFGVQAEYALYGRRDSGFWTSVGGGLGVGRIQVKPSSKRTGAPYATSGLGAAHLTAPFGYRFLPSFGLYAAFSVRVLFPDVLWVLDPALGVEGRL